MMDHLSLEETLLPAFFECFGIMLLGYILGKFGMVGQTEIRGVSKFVQYLALPALIFARLSTLNFNNMKWEFVAAVLVSKTCIFVCVVLMTILLTHPPDLGKSGIYGIVATQSNDFALAYPMFLSVYKTTHTEYPSYMYIVAPIQLVILNTIGIFIIETQKQSTNNSSSSSLWNITKQTLKNPIVFMTIIGIIWNVSIGHKIPPICNTLLQTLSRAFPGTALFLVGHTMAVRSGNTDRQIPITVTLLILTKNLILPIILQKFSAFMLQGSSESEIESLSSFGFLYGTVPVAPTAYVFAVQYEVEVDVVTKAIIGSTLLSAPLMFASASVISVSQIGFKSTSFYLSATISYLSIVSLLCCTWLLFSFIIGKRFRNIHFAAIIYMILSQLLTSLGGLLLFFSKPDNSFLFYTQYVLSIGGIYATRMYTLCLAVLLIIIRWRSLCYILQIKKIINFISVSCFVLPFIIATLALISKSTKYSGPNCQLGNIQTIITFTITLLCLIGTVLSLILQHVCFRKKASNDCYVSNNAYQTIEENESLESETIVKKRLSKPISEDTISFDVEDLGTRFENLLADSEKESANNIEYDLCDQGYNCSTGRRLQCATNVSNYRSEQERMGLYDDREIFQNTTLLIALCITMTLSLAVSFWRLIMEEVNGILIELEFLDVICNYSLGLLFFIVLGFNRGLLNTISKKWKILIYGRKMSTVENSIVDICHDFTTKYEKQFRIDMHNLKTERHNDLLNAFCYSNLAEWLIEKMIVRNRDEAETYILSLEEGKIIMEVDNSRIFPKDESIFKLLQASDI